MKKRLIIILLLLSLALFAKSRTEILWNYGPGIGLYTFTRSDIPETPNDETLPGGTLSVGLKTHLFVFGRGRNIGGWVNLDLKIPFRSVVDGEIKSIEAQEGSIQALTNLGFGLGFRAPFMGSLEFYGGLGPHGYFSYLHAFTLYSSPLLANEVQTEIEQYDAAWGLGTELGIKVEMGRSFNLMFGADFSWDLFSYQDTYVHIEEEPPIDYISVGRVESYRGLNISPYLTFGVRY